ncbi:MAG TPA: hypothetical protein VF529_19950 [Solirubrobacteraceae bacterium]|jgi:predicted transcriptional regulator
MHDEPSPAEAEAAADASVLELLTTEPALWSIDEIARELGDRITAVDAIARLHAAGLAHRLSDFVFATRAAAHAVQLQR